MTVQFSQIPGNLRVPLAFFEITEGTAPYQANSRLLLIGQKLASGNATADQPIQVFGDEGGLFGEESMIAGMYRWARKVAPFHSIWCLPVDDPAGAAKATGTITVAAPSLSAAATLAVYVGGQRASIVVSPTDTNTDIATNLTTAINALTGSFMTATSAAAVVTLTAVHGGVEAGKVRIETRLSVDDDIVADTLLTIVQPAGGAGDVDLSTPLANLGSEEFDWICAPYSDATNLGRVETFLGSAAGRWSPLQQLYGHYLTYRTDTPAAAATFGNARNNPHESIGTSYNSPTPHWLWAASLGGIAAAHLTTAPELSRPLQSLEMVDVLPPKTVADRLDITERQSLYFDGISGYSVTKDGKVLVDRVLTTYQRNKFGDEDTVWLDLNTIAQTMFTVRYIRQAVTSTWYRAALADDNPGGIQGLATPDAVRATVLEAVDELVNELGVLENYDRFNRDLIVERNPTDPNRLDSYMPFDVVNQLRVFAAVAAIYPQYPNS